MNATEAYSTVSGSRTDFARFYGPVGELSWGVGLLAHNLAFPIYDIAESEFTVLEGIAYVLSHECDIDQANSRPFNDMATVCPIIPLATALEDLTAARTDAQVRNFIDALARNSVDRVCFFPAYDPHLPFGGLAYLNALTHTHVSELERQGVEKLCAVSSFGLRHVDVAINNALLKRPKAQRLPLAAQFSSEASESSAGRNIFHAAGDWIEKIRGKAGSPTR